MASNFVNELYSHPIFFDRVARELGFLFDVKMLCLCKTTWRTKSPVLKGRILCLSSRETNFKQSWCVSLQSTNDTTIEGQKCSHSTHHADSRKFVVFGQVCVSSNFNRKFSTSSKCLTVNVDPNKNYYHILGVTPSCSITKVKQAYYRLSKVYHPDVNKTKAATARFHELTEAYEILSNPSLRHIYDSGRIEKLHVEHRGTVKPHPVNFSAKGPHQIRKNSKQNFDKQMKSNYSKAFQRFHEDVRKHEAGKQLQEKRYYPLHSDDSQWPLLIFGLTVFAGTVYALYVMVRT